MKIAIPLVLMTITVPLAGCDSRQSAGTVGNADPVTVAQQLKGAEQQWARDYAARDVGKLAGHYSADAALANPGAPLMSGSAAITKGITEFVADPNLEIEFASDRVQVARSGELAYTRGHFTMRSTDQKTHQPRTDSGSYLTVWQKQSDGSWKAVEDFSTPGPAAPQAK